jgi:hypothetical protein
LRAEGGSTIAFRHALEQLGRAMDGGDVLLG